MVAHLHPTQDAVLLDEVKTVLEQIRDGQLSGGALHDAVDGLEALLTTLAATDFATAAKQDIQTTAEQAAQAAVEALNTAHQSGGVTQVQLEAIKDAVEALDLDADLLATEAKQDTIISKIVPVATDGDQDLAGVTATWAEVWPADADRLELVFGNESAEGIEIGLGAEPPTNAEAIIYTGQGVRIFNDTRAIWLRCDAPHSVAFVEATR